MTEICSSALVTGGAGFIGSHLVDRLVADGCRVTVLDNLSAGTLDNLAGVKTDIRFIEGDILDQDCLMQAVRGCAMVFHLAAKVSVPYSVQHPVGSALVNELGTLRVLDAAHREGAGRVVYSSSSAVYGDRFSCPLAEDLAPVVCSPYALQKLTGERYADLFHHLYGLETVSLRYFNVYGPRQDAGSPYSGVISIFLEKALAGERPEIFGDGEQYRDFIFVGDVVQANLAAACCTGASEKVFNIGTGRRTSLNRLWKSVQRLTGTKHSPVYADPREGDIRASLADTRRTAAQLGFRAETTFENGLEATCEWYRRKAAG
jgi:nucleoside-diphosphate-sugar epimerase